MQLDDTNFFALKMVVSPLPSISISWQSKATHKDVLPWRFRWDLALALSQFFVFGTKKHSTSGTSENPQKAWNSGMMWSCSTLSVVVVVVVAAGGWWWFCSSRVWAKYIPLIVIAETASIHDGHPPQNEYISDIPPWENEDHFQKCLGNGYTNSSGGQICQCQICMNQGV